MRTAMALVGLLLAGCATGFAPAAIRSRHHRRASPRFGLPDIADAVSLNKAGPPQAKLLVVGGKGGVGKTTTSAAVAVAAAESGLRVLVCSTDPAHSLGDALDVADGTLVGGTPVPVFEYEGLAGTLDAVEVDADGALEKLRETAASLDLVQLAKDAGLGGPALDAIRALGVEELLTLLRDPPPGVDELVALADVTRLGSSGVYDVVVLDTAPTGHTLRLLELPRFLEGLLSRVADLRRRIAPIAAALGASGSIGGLVAKFELALERAGALAAEMATLRALLRDPKATDFVVVSAPTALAAAETKRLTGELAALGISARTVVANRVMGEAADPAFLRRMVATQQRWLARASEPGTPLARLDLTAVPSLDVEPRGVPGLAYLGGVAFSGPEFDRLKAPPAASGGGGGPKLVVVGGKGGVGKTSSAAALAIALADAGERVAVVSTDPAHSLGDALATDLSDGAVRTMDGVGEAAGGRLDALEVDPDDAVAEFRQALGGAGDGLDGSEAEAGDIIAGFADILDPPPPGLDELVALTRVVELLRKGEYDRIVVDTAPTGHTVRMLKLPEFLDDLVDRLLRVRDKLSGANPLVGMLKGALGRGDQEDAAANKALRERLRSFQLKFIELDDLFHDNDACEFLIVTIATCLAVTESERLAVELEAQGVASRHLLVNQLLVDDGDDDRLVAYGRRLAKGQADAVESLEALARDAGMDLKKVPLLDLEPRGYQALRAVAPMYADLPFLREAQAGAEGR